ncbi:hypothetical protein [Lentilactobacillus senioris]|nr:hypothetical protein [Lentilactobacillus senioris]
MLIIRMIGWILALIAVLVAFFSTTWSSFRLDIFGEKGMFKQLAIAFALAIISLGTLYFSGAI